MSATNIPNEPAAWDSVFSCGHLTRLDAVLRRDFVPTLLLEVVPRLGAYAALNDERCDQILDRRADAS